MSDELVSIRTEPRNGSLLVRLSGEIDLSNSEQVHQRLETAIDGWTSVIIDLTDVEYLDSQGLRLIKHLCNKVDRDGAELQLVAPPASFARQVLDMARMDEYAKIRDTLDV